MVYCHLLVTRSSLEVLWAIGMSKGWKPFPMVVMKTEQDLMKNCGYCNVIIEMK